MCGPSSEVCNKKYEFTENIMLNTVVPFLVLLKLLQTKLESSLKSCYLNEIGNKNQKSNK